MSESLISLVRRYLAQEIALGNWEDLAPETLPPEPGETGAPARAPRPAAAAAAPAQAPRPRGSWRSIFAGPAAGGGAAPAPQAAKVQTAPRPPFQPVTATPAEQLAELEEHVKACSQCQFCASRSSVVFGAGSPGAPVMFIGDIPREDDDILGQPFSGEAGRLLTDMIEKGMKLSRKEVYVTTVLKCRPPVNKRPKPEDANGCLDPLRWQIRIVRPKVIVALGAYASQCLLHTAQPIANLRGKFHTYLIDGLSIPVMPTFHPSYVLREYTLEVRRQVWEDLKQVLPLLSQN